MRMNSKPLLRHALTTTLLLVLSFAELRAAEEAAENDWQIDNATLTVVPSFQQLADGHWRERRPRSGHTFLEVRGTLKVAGDGSFGPHRLATAGLLAGAGAAPIAAELLAVGANSGICRYLRAPIGAGNETTAKLGDDREMAILRENSDDGPLLLRMHARSVELCMVFELPEAPPPSLRWSFAQRTMPLSVSAAATSNAATQTTTAASNSGLVASSRSGRSFLFRAATRATGDLRAATVVRAGPGRAGSARRRSLATAVAPTAPGHRCPQRRPLGVLFGAGHPACQRQTPAKTLCQRRTRRGRRPTAVP
jgi:hypothetical protein